MIEEHAEFKDLYQGLVTRSEEIAADLRDLPTDYRLAERYTDIDQEVYEVYKWYETRKKELQRYEREKREMNARVKKIDTKLKVLNNDVQSFKLQEFSRAQHGGSYSQLPQYLHQ